MQNSFKRKFYYVTNGICKIDDRVFITRDMAVEHANANNLFAGEYRICEVYLHTNIGANFSSEVI
jgi:hypothetical protein